MVILGSPQILGPSWVGGKLVHPRALVTTIPGSLKPDSRDPETETGNLETEKRVHRIHGTLETGLHKDASQPGGPHKGGRRILNRGVPICATTKWEPYDVFWARHKWRTKTRFIESGQQCMLVHER